jgi:hypothetical protein
MRHLFAVILLGGALLVGATAAYAAAADAEPWALPQVIVPPPIGQIQIAPLVPFGGHDAIADRDDTSVAPR